MLHVLNIPFVPEDRNLGRRQWNCQGLNHYDYVRINIDHYIIVVFSGGPLPYAELGGTYTVPSTHESEASRTSLQGSSEKNINRILNHCCTDSVGVGNEKLGEIIRICTYGPTHNGGHRS